MCRLVLMNKEGEKEIENTYGLSKYFKYLENQLGGHGNGYSLMKNGKVIDYNKGINLDVRDIAKKMQNTDYDWAIFHTRWASVGSKSDKNCHPFRREDTVLAMNGTEPSVSFIADTTEMTDTESILDLIYKYHLGLSTLRRFRSIFIGFSNKKPFIVANNTINIKLLKNEETKALVFASSFPYAFKKNIFEAKEGFSWIGGKLPNVFTKYVRRYYKPITFEDYGIYENEFEQLYLDAERRGGYVA